APPRDLPSKLTSEAYGVHFGSGGRASGAGTRVARDQGRSGELQDSLGSRKFLPGGSGSGRGCGGNVRVHSVSLVRDSTRRPRNSQRGRAYGPGPSRTPVPIDPGRGRPLGGAASGNA